MPLALAVVYHEAVSHVIFRNQDNAETKAWDDTVAFLSAHNLIDAVETAVNSTDTIVMDTVMLHPETVSELVSNAQAEITATGLHD